MTSQRERKTVSILLRIEPALCAKIDTLLQTRPELLAVTRSEFVRRAIRMAVESFVKT